MNIKELREIASSARSISEIVRGLGLNPTSGQSHLKVRKAIKENEIFCPKLRGHGWNKGETRATSPEVDKQARSLEVPWKQVFCKNSSYDNRGEMIKKLLRDKSWVYQCNSCELFRWQGKKLSLQLNHKNGVKNDHRISNLELLCPNCHSQTTTFAGRNTKRAKAKKK